MGRARSIAIWAGLAAALALPLGVAANSPLLAWREPVYVVAGFAGIVAFCLLLVQPLLAGGYLPGLPKLRARRVHGWVGAALVVAVLLHVLGLWVTSPPDVIDVLLFRSPTPFSIWGVAAMWAVFAAALLAANRRRLRPRNWRLYHTGLAVIIAVGTVVHALLIQGTMGTISKTVLCALALAALAATLNRLRPWVGWMRNRV